MKTSENETKTQPDTRAVYASAHRLLTAGQPRDAAVLFRLMLHIAPEDERAWLGLGSCHEAIEQLEVAAKLYAMGREASQSTRCLIAAARVCAKQGLQDEAGEIYDRALHEAVELECSQLESIARTEKARIHAR